MRHLLTDEWKSNIFIQMNEMCRKSSPCPHIEKFNSHFYLAVDLHACTFIVLITGPTKWCPLVLRSEIYNFPSARYLYNCIETTTQSQKMLINVRPRVQCMTALNKSTIPSYFTLCFNCSSVKPSSLSSLAYSSPPASNDIIHTIISAVNETNLSSLWLLRHWK